MLPQEIPKLALEAFEQTFPGETNLRISLWSSVPWTEYFIQQALVYQFLPGEFLWELWRNER